MFPLPLERRPFKYGGHGQNIQRAEAEVELSISECDYSPKIRRSPFAEDDDSIRIRPSKAAILPLLTSLRASTHPKESNQQHMHMIRVEVKEQHINSLY